MPIELAKHALDVGLVSRDGERLHRFYRDGTEETVRTPLADVARVEYEMVRTDHGMCSVVYVRLTDDSRYVFSDDEAVDLRFRAEKIARTIDKPFEATRIDVDGFADAQED